LAKRGRSGDDFVGIGDTTRGLYRAKHMASLQIVSHPDDQRWPVVAWAAVVTEQVLVAGIHHPVSTTTLSPSMAVKQSIVPLDVWMIMCWTPSWFCSRL
jgi:hypothetical protein